MRHVKTAKRTKTGKSTRTEHVKTACAERVGSKRSSAHTAHGVIRDACGESTLAPASATSLIATAAARLLSSRADAAFDLLDGNLPPIKKRLRSALSLCSTTRSRTLTRAPDTPHKRVVLFPYSLNLPAAAARHTCALTISLTHHAQHPHNSGHKHACAANSAGLSQASGLDVGRLTTSDDWHAALPYRSRRVVKAPTLYRIYFRGFYVRGSLEKEERLN